MPVSIVEDYDYHADMQEHINYHSLAEYIRCPAVYYAGISGLLPAKESPSAAFGTAFHMLALLGPQRFDAAYQTTDGPVNPSTGRPYGRETKAWAAWQAEQTMPSVSYEDRSIMEHMVAQIHEHRAANEILSTPNQIVEQVWRGDIDNIPVIGRIDMVNDRYIMDLKTCDDIDDFERDSRRYGYIGQLAFYHMLAKEYGLPTLQKAIVAVERRVPYRVGVWYITSDAIDQEVSKLTYYMRDMVEARKTGIYRTCYEIVRYLGL